MNLCGNNASTAYVSPSSPLHPKSEDATFQQSSAPTLRSPENLTTTAASKSHPAITNITTTKANQQHYSDGIQMMETAADAAAAVRLNCEQARFLSGFDSLSNAARIRQEQVIFCVPCLCVGQINFICQHYIVVE